MFKMIKEKYQPSTFSQDRWDTIAQSSGNTSVNPSTNGETSTVQLLGVKINVLQ